MQNKKWAAGAYACTTAMLAMCACVCSVEAATIAVAPGADLQAALTNAQPGDIIQLAPGSTYVGNFTLPNKGGGSATITLQTSPDGLPGEGVRISPAAAPQLAKLRSPNAAPVLQTAPGAHHWRIQLIEVTSAGTGDLITLGDGSSAQTTIAQVPHDLVIDRCYIHGEAGVAQKRGIALNSASTTISGSYISEIKAVGLDTQAILGWNGPGPFVIANNYLEGAGENVMFGGGDPSIPGLVPTDITITNNLVAKQPGWRGQSWQVKNLFELKNARHVVVQGNTFEYNWQAAQSGFGILFTVRNQDGGCPWCEVADITFQNNTVRHSAGGVSILGTDDVNPSRPTVSVTIRNNVFTDIDSQNWGGNGYFLQLLGGPRDVTIDHNTVIQDHASGIVTVDGVTPVFRFTNNLTKQNAYGIIGRDRAPGNDTIGALLPGSTVSHNVFADASAGKYPAGNWFPALAEFRAQFVSYDGGDYRLVASSPFHAAGTDGLDLGANLSASRPPAPGGLVASVSGSDVTLTWVSGGGMPSTYMVEAGSGPGRSDVAHFTTGRSATVYAAANVQSGIYFFRIRAASGTDLSPPSNEAVVVVGR